MHDSANITPRARMLVVGVGGGGSNAVTRMADTGLPGVELVALNTDAQALAVTRAHEHIQIGTKLTRGLGAGGRPDVGRLAAEESRDEIAEIMRDTDLVIVTCGMGGGTGTGAAPVVASIARAAGALVVGIVTRPFLFEGKRRAQHAELGLEQLRAQVDTNIVVPNERLLAVVGRQTTFYAALQKADEVLVHAAQGISSLVTTAGLVNLDFADVRTIMSDGGSAIIGISAASGPDRARDAAQQAITSPLLDETSIAGARGVLVNITGGPDMTLGEVHQVNEIIHEAVGDDAEIIFGAVHEPGMRSELRVTVIATGLPREEAAKPGMRAGQKGRMTMPPGRVTRAS